MSPKHTEQDVLSRLKSLAISVDEEQIRKIVRALVVLIGERVSGSRPGRPYRERLQHLTDQIKDISRLYGELELVEFQGQLMINDVLLGAEVQADEALAGLMLLLVRNRLRRVKFLPVLKAEELDLLCYWLAHGMVDVSKPRPVPGLALSFQAGLEPPVGQALQRGEPEQPAEPVTPPLGVLREPTTSSFRYDKVLYEEQARLVGKHKVSIFVHVGEIRLDGASIRINTEEGQSQRETHSGQPAIYYLTKGEYQVEVTYDKYTVKTRFLVVNEDLELEIDLQAYERYKA